MRARTVLQTLSPFVAALLPACEIAEGEPDDFDALARDALATIEGTLDVPGLRDEVEVIRDEWGIAHNYAENRDDLPVE